MSLASEIAQADSAKREFARKWRAEVIPNLKGNLVPAQFVLDVGSSLQKAWGGMADLQVKLLKDPRIILIAGGQSEAAGRQLLNVITEAGTLPNFLLAEKINPIFFAALEQRRKFGPKATVAIQTTGGGSFDSLVVQTIDAIAAAMRRLEEFESSIPFGAIGKVFAGAVLTILKAVDEVVSVITSVAGKVYESVVGLGRLIDLLMKGTLVAGAAYVAYLLFQPKEQPKQNPSRRRRRRRLAA